MAGTRLVSHTFFLVFSLISVLVAWRLGVVKRAPLPLEKMADPFNQNPPQPVSGASGSNRRGPLPPAVDMDLVLLRSPKDGDCPSCAAALDALQANPSLVRNAFRAAEEKEAARATTEQAATAATATSRNSGIEQQDGHAATQTQASAVLATVPLFTIREVSLRVVHAVHADNSPGAGNAAAPPLSASSTDGGGPVALDDWLHRLLSPPRQQQQQRQVSTAVPAAVKQAGEPTDSINIGSTSTRSTDSNPSYSSYSSPRYTFFIACAGAGDAGDLPAFIMGKRRHGYLGLGCGCSSCITDDGSSGGEGGSGAVSANSEPVGVAEGGQEVGGGSSSSNGESPVTPTDGARLAAEALQSLAGIIVAHVLRSPVRAGDVHVRQGQAYRLNFSLLSEDPTVRRCEWDFARASRRYLRPLLRKLRPVASFAVQVRWDGVGAGLADLFFGSALRKC